MSITLLQSVNFQSHFKISLTTESSNYFLTMYLFIHLLIHSFIYLLINLFIYSSINFFTYFLRSACMASNTQILQMAGGNEAIDPLKKQKSKQKQFIRDRASVWLLSPVQRSRVELLYKVSRGNMNLIPRLALQKYESYLLGFFVWYDPLQKPLNHILTLGRDNLNFCKCIENSIL